MFGSLRFVRDRNLHLPLKALLLNKLAVNSSQLIIEICTENVPECSVGTFHLS